MNIPPSPQPPLSTDATGPTTGAPPRQARPGQGTVALYWFRQDLRLADNPAWTEACARAQWLVPVACHDPAQDQPTAWGFVRRGPHRRRFEAEAWDELQAQLAAQGSGLLRLHGAAPQRLRQWAEQHLGPGPWTLYCEAIAAPEESAELQALQAAGFELRSHWQSGLLAPDALPFALAQLPPVFTHFRQAVEKTLGRTIGRSGAEPAPPPRPWMPNALLPAPLPAPQRVPPWPPGLKALCAGAAGAASATQAAAASASASSAIEGPALRGPSGHAPGANRPGAIAVFQGGSQAAQTHLARYFSGPLAHHYKATRNALWGAGHSTRFSPWLAQGSLSPRQVLAALQAFESAHGANEGSEWILFELLWREHFRLLHRQHGRRLYRAHGLKDKAAKGPSGPSDRHSGAPHRGPEGAHHPSDPGALRRWTEGKTGQPLVDAGMRELAATGWLSNRMRQLVASHWLHPMGGDWRAGAAWFESQLIDFDVHSNTGNWLYIAGLGTDPRGGRPMNAERQAAKYDPDGAYQRHWA